MALRYVRAHGKTVDEMHENMMQSQLYTIGDCILVWVNEGDFWMHEPLDVDAEDPERAEYERLKAKFESHPS